MPLNMRGILLSMTTVAAWLLMLGTLPAGEWPQILGPHRNGIADDEKLADAWPEGGPHILWKQPVGSGLAGPVVADGQVLLFHREGDQDVVEVFDAKTGKPGWKTGFPTRFRPSINPDDGPRAVPLIHGDRVFVFGASGDLRALSLVDGKELWSRQTHREFGAREGYFGAGSSPIVVDDKLLVNVGGRNKGAGVVAFSLDKGETLWQALKEDASYSSPVMTEIDGEPQVIFITRYKVVSLDPQDGTVHFEFPFGRRGPTVNGASPLVIGDRLFVTSHYGVGAVMARLGKDSAVPLWSNDESISSHYPTCISHEGYLYGIHGQERATPLHLRCVDAKTGEVNWSKNNFGIGTMILADGKLLLTMLNGDIVLVKPSPEKYIELARAKIGQSTTRPLPALADGKLYLRDETTLYCVELAK